MYREHTVGVVVPAYNESGFVGDVVRTVPEYVDRVYVVDDGSSDDTWAEIRRAATVENERIRRERESHLSGADATAEARGSIAERGAGGDQSQSGEQPAPDGGRSFDRRVVPLRHGENRGVGGAIKTGYRHALADELDVTAVMGGDGQMDPDLLPRLLDPIVDGEAEYAKGNRLLYEEYRTGMPPWRFFGNSILTLLTKVASGYWKMMDPQNGYTAISRHALERIDLEGLYEYYGYCNELLVRLNARRLRVADVAIPARYGDEQSHIQYPTYIRKVSLMLFRSFLWRLKVRYLVLDFHPLALFYGVGAATSIAGLLSGLWSMYGWKRLDRSLFVRGSMSLLTFLAGCLFVLFAMLFDMRANEDREIQRYE